MSLITLGLVIAAFVTFLTVAIAALPDISQYPLPDWIASSLTTIVGTIRDLHAIFPNFVTAIFITFVFMTVVNILVFGWKGVRLIIRIVRGAHV